MSSVPPKPQLFARGPRVGRHIAAEVEIFPCTKRVPMLQGFTEWLTGTGASAMFSDTTRFATWLIIPVSQCVHLICVAIVMISVGMLNLRLLGVAGTRQSFAELAVHLMPWIWADLTVLFVTGTIQTVAEPGRELLNVGFKTKMVLLMCAVAITLVYENTVKKDPNYWERSPERRKMAQVLASISLVLWIGIASAGRLIAYLDLRHEQ